jgi:hypothetical protein
MDLINIKRRTLTRAVSRWSIAADKGVRPQASLCDHMAGKVSVGQVLRILGFVVRGSNPGEGRDFPHQSRPALRPTQPPVQWVPGLSPGVRCGRGVTLTPHPLLIPRSKIE